MVEEAVTQVVARADPSQPGLGRHTDLVEGIGAQVGQFGGFHAAPDLFDEIELRRLVREAFDVEPVALGGQPRGHRAGPVGHEPVPDHDDLLAGEMGA